MDLENASVAELQTIRSQVEVIAQRAGMTIAAHAREIRQVNVEVKGVHDFVTNVDKESERLILTSLSDLLPGVGILSEEGAGVPSKDGYNWIIDPLDGTTNFIHAMPPYAVSIGLAKGNEVLLGVVHEVSMQETFSAVKGCGAYCNGQRIMASSCHKIDDALIATGFPYYNYERLPQFMQTLEYFMQHSHGLRRLGSAATDLAYVACGRVDAFYEYGLKPWDVAAGIIIAQEAGVRFADYGGGENYLYGGELLCATKRLFDEFQGVVVHLMSK